MLLEPFKLVSHSSSANGSNNKTMERNEEHTPAVVQEHHRGISIPAPNRLRLQTKTIRDLLRVNLTLAAVHYLKFRFLRTRAAIS